MNTQKIARVLLVVLVVGLLFLWCFWNTIVGEHTYLNIWQKITGSLIMVFFLGSYVVAFWHPIPEMDKYGNIINEEGNQGSYKTK